METKFYQNFQLKDLIKNNKTKTCSCYKDTEKLHF